MMGESALFSSLGERLQGVLSRLKGRGKLTEKDVEAALREVRLALLEADVNFKVARGFVTRVKERAVGSEVLESLTPGQQVVKIVADELAGLMGGEQVPLRLRGGAGRPSVVLMAGLQGAGKTTTSAKLAVHLKKQGRRPLLVAADVYRPAAIKQLQVLGDQIQVPVFALAGSTDPVAIAEASLAHAKSHGNDIVIVDTAGRLHVDEEMMAEISALKSVLDPDEILLVVDAMTGQDAVNVAQRFDELLGLDGVVLTKLDGDARGGAALSIKEVTGKPIKFTGVGEKTDALEPFHPDRMARRILGMGDVLSLIEKAEAHIDEATRERMAAKLKSADFTLEDFLDQMEQVRNMGPLDQLLGMIPGMGNLKALKDVDLDGGEMRQIEAIIRSMTPKERSQPGIIDASRRRRIAAGSGTRVQDVNRLLKQFQQTRTMMKQLGSMERAQKKGKNLFRGLFH